jgi:ferredoxin/flavodoxin---NADP+ reductase
MPLPTSTWIPAKVVSKTAWTEQLFSLRFTADIAPFQAGQFVKLGLDIDGERIGRPFSLVNSPNESVHEIVAVAVASGQFSPVLNRLTIGDSLWVQSQANGFFTLSDCPPAQTLWCIASGTGIGPYLSMLKGSDIWSRYQRVVLVHGVRHEAELCYQAELQALAQRKPLSVVNCVTQGQTPYLNERITTAYSSGRLATAAGQAISADTSHVLLCGNPAMVSEMQALLLAQGLKKHRRREPGQVTVETYWN